MNNHCHKEVILIKVRAPVLFILVWPLLAAYGSDAVNACSAVFWSARDNERSEAAALLAMSQFLSPFAS
jgi:hypothetical protein